MADTQWLRDNAELLNLANKESLIEFADDYEKLQQRIPDLEDENDKLRDALVRIDNWAKAYPCDVFLKPDLKQAARVLGAAGMTLDAISADAMRHVLDGVKDITEQALKGE